MLRIGHLPCQTLGSCLPTWCPATVPRDQPVDGVGAPLPQATLRMAICTVISPLKGPQ